MWTKKKDLTSAIKSRLGPKNGRVLCFPMRAGYAQKHSIYATFEGFMERCSQRSIPLKKRSLKGVRSCSCGQPSPLKAQKYYLSYKEMKIQMPMKKFLMIASQISKSCGKASTFFNKIMLLLTHVLWEGGTSIISLFRY